jgi:hypothetical protein
LIPLDIEFAVKKDKKIVIFQTRPLVINSKIIPNEKEIYKTIRSLRAKFRRLSKQRKHITGSFTYFTDMTDWNPAEKIGSSPNTLAYSLYDYLITRSVWHKAKAGLGYTNVNPAKLVHLFGNKPYVDVRSNFNAFIPSRVPLRLKKKLMCFFMKKLRENPHLQDKVEFEILYTCFDFSIESRFNELLKEGFNLKDIRILKKILVELNNNLLKDDPLETDFKINEEMEKDRERVSCLKNVSAREKINNGLKLLKICKNKGTLQFARITRLAFISNCLLRSLITQKIITQDEYDSFYSSINTVLTDFTKDVSLYFAKKISSKIFLQKYGHLRPGTYDITVSRYDKTPYYFFQNSICYFPNKSRLLINENNENKQKKISILLKKEGIKIDVKNLFKIMKKALQLRENSKFLFTKCLSDALEMIAEGTSELGFSRYEVSFLSLRELKKALTKGDKEMTKYLRNQVEASRKKYQLNSNLSLPPILFSEKDFNIISYYKAEPNYITSQKIGGELFFLEGNLGNKSSYDFSNKLVVIENADPGYDWIFLKNPAGVITKYGGVASHMSIRCAELQIPAAIGCGDVIYNSLKKMNSAILDCNNRRLIELN